MFRQPGTDAVSEESLPHPIPAEFGAAGNAARREIHVVGLLDFLSQLFDRGRSPAELAKWLELPEDQLRDWQRGQPPEPRGRDFYYNEFTIPKKRGGTRTIHAPSEGLKALQRRILYRLLNPLPIHPAATGFVPGRSIVTNARPHAGHGVVINIDLADFFPSISAERVRGVFRALGWSKQAATILTNICTHEGHLPQGAPTSPALSNLACRKLDARLAAISGNRGGEYTRYADDLTFSFPAFGKNELSRNLPEGRGAEPASRTLLTTIRKIIEEEGFKIQMKKKVRVQRAHQRQTATGLVVNATVNLPRAARRRLRAMQHRERKGLLEKKALKQLRGWEALLAMVLKQRSQAPGDAPSPASS